MSIQPAYQTLGAFTPAAPIQPERSAELSAAYERITQLESTLGECRDYFEVRADAEYFTDRAAPVGTPEMQMLCAIDAVLS